MTAASGAPGDGLEDMGRGVELLREQKVVVQDGLLKIALAEAEAWAGDPNRAVAILDEALATADHLGYRAKDALAKHKAKAVPSNEHLSNEHLAHTAKAAYHVSNARFALYQHQAGHPGQADSREFVLVRRRAVVED